MSTRTIEAIWTLILVGVIILFLVTIALLGDAHVKKQAAKCPDGYVYLVKDRVCVAGVKP